MSATADALDQVESRLFKAVNFRLESGVVLPELVLAYETYGQLGPDRRNAVLLTHGYSSSHHAAGRYKAGKAALGLSDGDVGWWDKLVGPGKAIDTSRLFVVSSNMLGSAYGSTGPRSINPATGRPYGPDFPRLTVADIVRAQRLLLDHLGVERLVAVAGPSYGGYQAFQWAVTFPDHMRAIVPVVTAPRSIAGPPGTKKLIDELAQDSNWNGGHYYDKGGVVGIMRQVRIATLKRYGIEAELAPHFPDPAAREREIARRAEPWAQAFDANSLVVLRRALEGFDTTAHFPRLKARVLYVISRTDVLFSPAVGATSLQRMKGAGVDARYLEIDSELGHLASGLDAEKWAHGLAAFMREVMAAEGQ